MDLIAPTLAEYLDNIVPPRHPEMRNMEAYAAEQSFPIVGPACGFVCYQLARTLGATRVFEMGSGFGYSTAWLAQAVKENGGGEVHHVVRDPELSRQAQEHLSAMGFEGIVKYTIGEAIQTLHSSKGPFDLIFMDIQKTDYPKALSGIYNRLRLGGLLLIDNMLWSGRIFDEQDQTPATQAIRETAGVMMSNSNWIASILPIRDGLMMATKVA